MFMKALEKYERIIHLLTPSSASPRLPANPSCPCPRTCSRSPSRPHRRACHCAGRLEDARSLEPDGRDDFGSTNIHEKQQLLVAMASNLVLVLFFWRIVPPLAFHGTAVPLHPDPSDQSEYISSGVASNECRVWRGREAKQQCPNPKEKRSKPTETGPLCRRGTCTRRSATS